jgi:hypothetical protein
MAKNRRIRIAAGRLQHLCQPAQQQEFLNGRFDRRQEALEWLV